MGVTKKEKAMWKRVLGMASRSLSFTPDPTPPQSPKGRLASSPSLSSLSLSEHFYSSTAISSSCPSPLLPPDSLFPSFLDSQKGTTFVSFTWFANPSTRRTRTPLFHLSLFTVIFYLNLFSMNPLPIWQSLHHLLVLSCHNQFCFNHSNIQIRWGTCNIDPIEPPPSSCSSLEMLLFFYFFYSSSFKRLSWFFPKRSFDSSFGFVSLNLCLGWGAMEAWPLTLLYLCITMHAFKLSFCEVLDSLYFILLCIFLSSCLNNKMLASSKLLNFHTSRCKFFFFLGKSKNVVINFFSHLKKNKI